MKLRLRHYQGGPTQRLDVENDCTLRSLRAAVAALTGQNVDTVRVSLNKLDELDGPGNLLVSSLGVCGGDLLYLLDPRRPDAVRASAAPGAQESGAIRASVPASGVSNSSRLPGTQLPKTTGGSRVANGGTEASRSVGKVDVAQERRERCAAAAAKRLAGPMEDGLAIQHPGPVSVAPPAASPISMDIDNAAPETAAVPSSVKASELQTQSTSPAGLQEVVTELVSKVGSGQDLLILTLHAVMLETGFSLVPVGASLEQCWQPTGGRTLLRYALAAATGATNPSLVCTLRCQQLGANLLVYGSCDEDAAGTIYRLNLPVSKHLRPIPAPENRTPAQLLSLFKNAQQLFVEIKDSLSVPLLSLLCQRAGVSPPPSLILLPLDAKNNILAKLPARDLAAIAMTCSELREAASGDEFWRALFVREFPRESPAVRPGKWKEEFRRAWVERRLQREQREEYERQLGRMGRREARGFRYQPPGMVGEFLRLVALRSRIGSARM